MFNKLKEPISGLTHIIGALLSVAALVVLISEAAVKGTAWHVVSFAIYATSLILLYTASAVYHSLNLSKHADEILRQLDHAMVYILIAGTYTPLCLVVLQGGWGWSLFGVNWALAITGVVLKLVFRNPSRGLIAVLFTFYILMGWLIVIAWFPLMRVLPSGGVFWLVLGGIFYTAGAAILNIKRLRLTAHFGSHELWHLFVMAGSLSHFWMMWKYVMYLGG